MNLNDLLLDLSNIPENELENFARAKYREIYVTSGNRGVMNCHDGDEVIFWESRFDHAFYTPKNWRETSVKQVLDKRRIERMAWIRPLICGDVPNSACWIINENLVKRMYAVASKGYLVWLELKRDGSWQFSSAYAYVADISYIYKQTRGQSQIWKK